MEQRAWRSRLLGEFAVIVLGILLALAVDSAVDAAGARKREAEYLSTLRQDFRADSARLVGMLASLREIAGASGELIKLRTAAGPTISADSIAKLIRDANSFEIFTPSSSAVQAIIDSGDLRLFRDAQLRNLLAGWNGVQAEQRHPESYIIRGDELLRQLRDIPIAHVYRLVPGQSPASPAGYLRAIRTSDFQNIVGERLLITTWNHETTKRTLAYVEKILKQLGN
jgi:hypothetical protein